MKMTQLVQDRWIVAQKTGQCRHVRPQRQIPASPIHGSALMELFDQLSDIRCWIEDFHGPAETRSTGRV
jgi:hypothetical protein